MKTIILGFFCFFSVTCRSQVSDLIYLPKEKTVIGTLKYDSSPIGYYVGGYITTSFPQPYIYTTPISIINRVGLSFVGSGNKWGVMVGGKIQNFDEKVILTPEYWLKVHPLKILTNTRSGFDFVLLLNYQREFNYGIGISIPFNGIY